MLIRLAMGLLLLLFVPGMSDASDAELKDIIAALEVPFKEDTATTGRIRDFHADFFQESQIASINRIQRGQGQVSFKFFIMSGHESPKAMFRWEYLEPNIQEIISDGRTMWVYLPESRQVIESDIRQVNAEQGENPISFLGGLGNLSRDFSITLGAKQTDDAGNYLLQFVPLKGSQLIRQMQVVVLRPAVSAWQKEHRTGQLFPIVSTMVTDPNGNRTLIEFRDARVNRNLADNLFKFEKPDNVELVKPGEQLQY